MNHIQHPNAGGQQAQGRQIVTGPMYRPGPVVTSDRQLEVARRYRSDGTLEAERLRIRERTGYVSSDAEHPGCLVAWAQGLAGMLYIIAAPTLGYWLAGWSGAVVAFLLISIQVARHW